jgi:phosphinothricin acetyltransferase
MDVSFRVIQTKDLHFVKKIYDDYIINTTSTFHTDPMDISKLKEMMIIGNTVYPSYIISEGGLDCGYCYLSEYKNRQAYRRTAEVTIYLKNEFTGRGIGRRAMEFITQKAGNSSIKNLIAIISGENLASIRFIERSGFIKCGHIKNAGEKFGRLLDVVFYQKELK